MEGYMVGFGGSKFTKLKNMAKICNQTKPIYNIDIEKYNKTHILFEGEGSYFKCVESKISFIMCCRGFCLAQFLFCSVPTVIKFQRLH